MEYGIPMIMVKVGHFMNISELPEYNSMTSIAIEGDKIFVGNFFGGIFFSTDKGRSWSTVNNGLTNLQISCIATNGTNIFAGTSGGVYLTTNNGTNWTCMNNGLGYAGTNDVISNDGNLYAGTNGEGVFLSTNNGATWLTFNNTLNNPFVNEIIIDSSYIFGGTSSYEIGGGGVISSNKTIANWSNVDNGIENDDFGTIYLLFILILIQF